MQTVSWAAKMKIMHSGNLSHLVREGNYAAKVAVGFEYLGENWEHVVNPDDLAKLERVSAAMKAGNLASAQKEATVFELRYLAG